MADWPIGTPAERAASKGSIPGKWLNSNPFGNYYEIAPGVWNYHDGVDLNLNAPGWNADWHKPVYAMDDGVVYFAGIGGGSWGHIICIAHVDPLIGRLYYSRYGHIEKPIVKAGDIVRQGQQIAQVGNADGYYGSTGAHLHFNICTTELMHTKPNQWCGANRACVYQNYVNPVEFIKARYTMTEPVTNPDTLAAIKARLGSVADTEGVIVVFPVPPQDPTKHVDSYEVIGRDMKQIFGLPYGPIPTPDPAPVQTAQKWCTATDGLYVRATPVSGKILGSFAYQAVVQVKLPSVNGWYQVILPGSVIDNGWVSGTYLSDTRP